MTEAIVNYWSRTIFSWVFNIWLFVFKGKSVKCEVGTRKTLDTWEINYYEDVFPSESASVMFHQRKSYPANSQAKSMYKKKKRRKIRRNIMLERSIRRRKILFIMLRFSSLIISIGNEKEPISGFTVNCALEIKLSLSMKIFKVTSSSFSPFLLLG